MPKKSGVILLLLGILCGAASAQESLRQDFLAVRPDASKYAQAQTQAAGQFTALSRQLPWLKPEELAAQVRGLGATLGVSANQVETLIPRYLRLQTPRQSGDSTFVRSSPISTLDAGKIKDGFGHMADGSYPRPGRDLDALTAGRANGIKTPAARPAVVGGGAEPKTRPPAVPAPAGAAAPAAFDVRMLAQSGHTALFDADARFAGVLLGIDRNKKINLQSLTAPGLLTDREAKHFTYFLPDLTELKRFALLPTLLIAVDGKKQLVYGLNIGGKPALSATSFDDSGAVVNYFRAEASDFDLLKVYRGYFLRDGSTPDWAVKEEYKTVHGIGYDPAQGFTASKAVSYAKWIWDQGKKQHVLLENKVPQDANAWDALIGRSSWIMGNAPILRELGAGIGFTADRGRDLGLGLSVMAAGAINSASYNADRVAYEIVTHYQMPLVARRKNAPAAVMKELQARLGKDFELYRGYWTGKYKEHLLKEAADPQMTALSRRPGFKPSDEELGNFLITGQAAAGFLGAAHDAAARAAESKTYMGETGHLAAATGIYAADFIMQSMGFHGMAGFAAGSGRLAQAANAPRLVKAADAGVRLSQRAQGTYFQAIMAQQSLELGKALSHDEREAIMASLSQLAALGRMPGGNKERERRASPLEFRAKSAARELALTSPLVGIVASAQKAASGLSQRLRERRDSAKQPVRAEAETGPLNPKSGGKALRAIAGLRNEKAGEKSLFDRRSDKDILAELERHLRDGEIAEGTFYRAMDPGEYAQWMKSPGGLPRGALYRFAGPENIVTREYGKPGLVLVKIQGRAVPYRKGAKEGEVLVYEAENAEIVREFKEPAVYELADPAVSH